MSAPLGGSVDQLRIHFPSAGYWAIRYRRANGDVCAANGEYALLPFTFSSTLYLAGSIVNVSPSVVAQGDAATLTLAAHTDHDMIVHEDVATCRGEVVGRIDRGTQGTVSVTLPVSFSIFGFCYGPLDASGNRATSNRLQPYNPDDVYFTRTAGQATALTFTLHCPEPAWPPRR